MKASEALVILEALDPSHEVTLIIGRKSKQTFPPSTPVVTDVFSRQWVIGKETWPTAFPITCKTVH